VNSTKNAIAHVVWMSSIFIAACTSSGGSSGGSSGDASADGTVPLDGSSDGPTSSTDSGPSDSGSSDSGASDSGSSDSGVDAADSATDGAPSDGGPTYVVLDPAKFHAVTDAGQTIDLYTIKNTKGVSVSLTNYGSRIEQIIVPDRNGRLGDVVLGYDSIAAVMGGEASAGAFIGRYANRIAGGTFTLNAVPYTLTINDGTRPNTIHGGTNGSRFRVFAAKPISQSSIEMDYTFQDMEEGFPGVLALKVVYSIDDMNQLTIDYSATAGAKDTVGNFTQHPFFNLSGDLGSVALDHVVTVNADRVLEINANLIPTGVIRPVAGTVMDFNTPKPIGQDITATYDLLTLAGGYDNTYVIKQSAADGGPEAGAEAGADASGPASGPVFNARIFHPTSGRTVEIWSTEPSVQLYSGNGISGTAPKDQGIGGVIFVKHGGVAIEPMHYPDSPNEPSFPTTVISANQTYTGKIVYKFGTQP
jgi:aldose 1-epimerase